MLDRFYYEVLQPWLRLEERAGQNICVATHFSDVVSLGNEAAIAAYHHWEKVHRANGSSSVPPMTSARAEWLRQRLGELSDSAKHGTLRSKERQTAVKTALGFEFNASGKFRFLRTVLIAANRNAGEFDVAETIREYLQTLCIELKYNVEIAAAPPTSEFIDAAVTYFYPQPFITIPTTSLSFFTRRADGKLERADPSEVKFEVREVRS